jgi:hypothetical protein
MKPVPTIVLLLAVAAILIVVFAAGWADDRATPGSRGRGQVTPTQTVGPR